MRASVRMHARKTKHDACLYVGMNVYKKFDGMLVALITNVDLRRHNK